MSQHFISMKTVSRVAPFPYLHGNAYSIIFNLIEWNGHDVNHSLFSGTEMQQESSNDNRKTI